MTGNCVKADPKTYTGNTWNQRLKTKLRATKNSNQQMQQIIKWLIATINEKLGRHYPYLYKRISDNVKILTNACHLQHLKVIIPFFFKNKHLLSEKKKNYKRFKFILVLKAPED